jgi:hypothetical protein
MLIKRVPYCQPESPTRIWLNARVFVLCDLEDYLELSQYRWRLRRSGSCFYAVRRIIQNGRTIEIKMHRQIMNTISGYECHHINHNTLDNRRVNLQNLLPSVHASLHAIKEYGGVCKVCPNST